MKTKFGPCKLIWHYKNKKMAFDFMPDQTQLILDMKVKSCDMRLQCEFKKPDYGELIAAWFIKLMSKDTKPRQLLMIPNYGMASKEQSMEFHRAQPNVMSAKKIIFLLLPTDDKREWMQQKSKKI